MEFQRMKLSDLHPAEYNPRKKLTPEDPEWHQIRRSIQEFGYADPIVINRDGTIIKGHQRCSVMMDLGITEADVIVLDIPDKSKEKALNIALNRITGKWDESLLTDLLQELDLNGYDFSVSGFSQDDLSDMIQALTPPEATEDEFDPDQAARDIGEPVSRPGTLWQLGRHRLLCGDTARAEDVSRLTGGTQLDLVITDPPYGVNFEEKINRYNNKKAGNLFNNRTRGTHNQITGDQANESDFYGFLLTAIQNIEHAMKPGAALYIFHADHISLICRKALRDAGIKLRQVLIWEKQAFVIGRNDYQWIHEPILYAWKDGAPHYFINDRSQSTVLQDPLPDFKSMKKRELLDFLDRIFQEFENQSTVIAEARPIKSPLHPSMKPVPLIGRLMTNSSRPGWTVGDFFAGSGTTLIAAEQLDRKCYCMELDPFYCDIIVKRWEQFTGERAERLP